MPHPGVQALAMVLDRKRTTPRQRKVRRARASLLMGTLFFVALQLGLATYIDYCRPELRDAEYGQKLARLRSQLAEAPDRPLIVILGSSRSELGFRPAALPALRVDNEPALVFNGALTGSGPVIELLCLRRLLSAGIHPRQVIVEILPPLLHQEGAWAEEKW